MKLHAAITLAEAIQRELQGFCSRIEIAGSIRRARPEVNDIDLVVLPAPNTKGNFTNLELLKARCRMRCRVIQDGKQNFICAMRLPDRSEFQIDIFFVEDLLNPQPSNFGSLLLCRTGSKEHNIQIARRAKSMEMHWNPSKGLFAGGLWELEGQESVYKGGQIIASESEDDIFKALKLEPVAPAYREVPNAEQILNGSAGRMPDSTSNAVQETTS